MEKIYDVSGLSCQGCVAKLTELLSEIKGVEVLEVNLDKHQVRLKTSVWKWRLNLALKGSKFKLK